MTKQLQDCSTEDIRRWCCSHQYGTLLNDAFHGMSGKEIKNARKFDILDSLQMTGLSKLDAKITYKELQRGIQIPVTKLTVPESAVPDYYKPKKPSSISSNEPKKNEKPLREWSSDEFKRWCSNHKRSKLLLNTFEGMSGVQITVLDRNKILKMLQEKGDVTSMVASATYNSIASLGLTEEIGKDQFFPESYEGSSGDSTFVPECYEGPSRDSTLDEGSSRDLKNIPFEDWNAVEIMEWSKNHKTYSEVLVPLLKGLNGKQTIEMPKDKFIKNGLSGFKKMKQRTVYKKLKDEMNKLNKKADEVKQDTKVQTKNKQKYKAGDKVKARWTDGHYYNATIIKKTDIGYLVDYYEFDGTQYDASLARIMGAS